MRDLFTAKVREVLSVERVLNGVSAVLALSLALWVIYYAWEGVLPQRQHANLVLGAGLAIFYFAEGRDRIAESDGSVRSQVVAAALVTMGWAALAAATYVHFVFDRWLESGNLLVYTDVDLLIGLLLIVLVTDATYRKYGVVLGLVVLGAIGYGLAGPYLPGVLEHSGLSVEEVIRRQSITLTGIYGLLLQVGATWIAIFIIFAGAVEGYGGFEYILECGHRLRSWSRSGVAQTAVVSSMFMGTMMGSSASNVATTGSFTIPLMKDQGLPGRFAAAAESVASTGGQILPPIMGTAAFLMADILGIPFVDVAIASVIPALLFYISTSTGIHFKITKSGWGGESGAAFNWRNPDWAFIIRGIQYLLPLGVLIYVLMVARLGPMTAGIYTIAALALTRIVRATYETDPWSLLTDTADGLQTGGENLAPFVTILGSLGVVINIFSVTGLAQTIAVNMVTLAGGALIVLLLLAMVVSLLFGLGMPTPAAYILVATILAPGLTEVGIPQLSAHLFVFYFALLSALTPPVALAVTIGMGIAGSKFLPTAKNALQLGLPTFFIPFVFISNPVILNWEFPQTLIVLAVLIAGMLALVSALVGFNGRRSLSVIERGGYGVLFLVAAFAPSTSLQVSAAVGYVLVTSRFIMRVRRAAQTG